EVEGTEFLALVLGDVGPDEPTLVRVQTAALMRDVFGIGAAPDDHPATVSLRLIEQAGKGGPLYVFPRRRASLEAGSGAQPPAAEPSAPRLRNFGLGAQVLTHLGVRTIRLLTNHPRRIVGIGGYGLEVVECVPIKPTARVVALREGGAGGAGKIPA